MVEWLRNAVVYQIMVDRFSTGNPEKDALLAGRTSKDWIGGNLRGIIKHIGHIKKLANVIYMSPIYSASEYHGYSIIDFFELDRHFGKKEDLKKLAKLCHVNNMKLILDFVPNHVSSKNPIFLKAQNDRNCKYFSWFIFDRWPNKYMCFLDMKELPKINLDNRDARNYIIAAAKYWMNEFEIDGFRLDHSIGPSLDFWEEFRKEIKSVKDDFALIGEAGKALGSFLKGRFEKNWIKTLWLTRSFSNKDRKKVREIMNRCDLNSCIEFNDLMMKYSEKILDGCIDFSFGDLAWALAADRITKAEFDKKLEEHYKKFKKDFVLMTLLSNHDRGRFISYFGKRKTIKISSEQFSINQPALIYYGEEIGLNGRGPFEKARRFMIWDEKAWDKGLLKHYKFLSKSRLCGQRNLSNL
jgi:glycosidase